VSLGPRIIHLSLRCHQQSLTCVRAVMIDEMAKPHDGQMETSRDPVNDECRDAAQSILCHCISSHLKSKYIHARSSERFPVFDHAAQCSQHGAGLGAAHMLAGLAGIKSQAHLECSDTCLRTKQTCTPNCVVIAVRGAQFGGHSGEDCGGIAARCCAQHATSRCQLTRY
jgi:hypothetical protein